MKRIDATALKSVVVGIDTHPGETGKNNEDSGGFFAFELSERNDTVVHLGVVADGIGGHQAGERASQMGVAILESYFNQAGSPRVVHHLEEAFKAANARIVSEGKKHPELAGMGTTMTAAVIMNNGLYVAHVGDSRAYLIRNGAIHQLTTDHTWAQEAIEAGRLTLQEAKTHPNRNVIKRYMGIQPNMEVDFRLRDPEKPGPADEQNQGLMLRRGDVVLLCSDGLSDLVDDPDILGAVKDQEPQQAAEQLVRMARANGGYDNITVVAIQVRTGPPPAAAGGRFKRAGLLGVGVIVLVGAIAAAAMFLGGDRELEPTVTPVATVVEPTVTPSMTSAPASTPVPTTTAGPTAVPTPTAIETEAASEGTSVPATPTSVPTFTPTNTPTATYTRLPPTATPTATETPTPTETAQPPTEEATTPAAEPTTPAAEPTRPTDTPEP